jgi:hypothetical protein
VEREIPFSEFPHPEYIYEKKDDGTGMPYTLLNTDTPFLEGLTVSGDDKYLVFPRAAGLFAYEYRSGKMTWLTEAPAKWVNKDRNPSYAPDDATLVFERAGNVYLCEAM